MKNVSRALLVAIGLGSGAVLAAQSGTTTGAGRSAQPGQQSRGQASTVTVAGCLQRSDTTAAAGSSSTAASSNAASSTAPGNPLSSSGATFILTNVSSGAGTGSSSTARASGGRGGMMGAGRTYTLVENKPGELTTHVGHQIEVTGTIAAAGTMGGAMANQRLQVTSIRMIAATCTSTTTSTTTPTTTPATTPTR